MLLGVAIAGTEQRRIARLAGVVRLAGADAVPAPRLRIRLGSAPPPARWLPGAIFTRVAHSVSVSFLARALASSGALSRPLLPVS